MMADAAITQLNMRAALLATAHLTAREDDCIALMASGFSFAQAAHALGIAHRTVRFHVTNAKTKAKAKSVEHLVAIWTAHRVRLEGLSLAHAGGARGPAAERAP